MHNIKDVVSNIMTNLGLQRPATPQAIQVLWSGLLTKKELQHTIPVNIVKGKLIVHVDSPAWLYQVNMQKTKLLKDIQKQFPEIKELIFKVGKMQ